MYIVAHVPPGVFELVDGMSWFYLPYNKKYLGILTKYASVIAGQMYGHEHTDSFRILYDNEGKCVLVPPRPPTHQMDGENKAIATKKCVLVL